MNSPLSDDRRPSELDVAIAGAEVRISWALLGLPTADILPDPEAGVVWIGTPTAHTWARWRIATNGRVRVTDHAGEQVWTAEHTTPGGVPVIARYVRRVRTADTTTAQGETNA